MTNTNTTKFTPTPEVRIFVDTVEIDGESFPRCVRAVGIAQCTGHVTVGNTDCGWHA